jgi:hypothetical protein
MNHNTSNFGDEWSGFKEELKYPFGNSNREYLITDRQLQALKNLIFLARERLWLCSNWPKTPEYHIDYDQDMADDVKRISDESIKEMETVVRLNADRLEVPVNLNMRNKRLR